MKQNISYKDALTIALTNTFPTQKIERINIKDALNRVLAEDIKVKKNLPSYNNAAMDGFAYAYKNRKEKLKIVQTVLAGENVAPMLEENQCYKIMTGAKVPNDADTVVAFENCQIENGYVRVPQNLPQGANLRYKGEEISVGSLLLSKGDVLRSSEIALLASQGITEVEVYKKLSIAVFASGNELKEPWEEASEDEIYNVNGISIVTFLQEKGYDASYIGKLPDDLSLTTTFIANLLSYDVIISTGGISAGEADFLYQAFKNNQLVPFFKGVKIKPGHPVMVGSIDSTTIIALPGNPLATLLIAFALALPIIEKKQGKKEIYSQFFYAPLKQDLSFHKEKTTIVIGKVHNGAFYPTNGAKVSSAMLTPLSTSNAIAFFDEGSLSFTKESLIKVIFLHDQTKTKKIDFLN